MLRSYFQDIFNTQKRGDAREESYYSSLERLLNNWIKEKNKRYQVTVLPKKTEGGNPDFRIWDGRQKIVGYIEVKDPSVENLDIIENSEQLKRYRDIFPNLILTNLFEFRLYRNCELIKQVAIGRTFTMFKLETIPAVENQDKFFELLEQFFSFSISKISTSKQLAIELAKRTRFLKEQLIAELDKESHIEGTQALEGFYKSFKEYLISSLTFPQFADLFAQTITYGLFVARSRSESNIFERKSAFDFIPHTIGILRKVFQFVSATDLPISMKIVDDITEILAATDVKKIIHRFYHENKGKDPIIHFYETFLEEYDPKERASRGVYYTPESVVGYIVRSISTLLKDKFNKLEGFATNSVTVLDPAAGTLTFPAKAIELAINEYKSKYGDGGIKELIRDHIIKNFYAFELMMAPYAVGHLKISLLLEELGYKMQDDDRFKLYLTNTLEMKELSHTDLPLFTAIADESNQALVIKKTKKVIVVFGNPPYSVSSLNKITKENELYNLYESYKETVRKEEKNIQPLSDDYIKFLAFAHYKIKQSGEGIVGMITNNSYLDGIIHRDMRRKLMEEFNQIYILNLHGSSKKKETSPSGGKDENVFDIQQGVSIVLLVKGEKMIRCVKYFDLWGLREEKYNFLDTHDIKNTPFEFLTPKEKYYFFVKKDFKTQNEYDNFIPIGKIFDISSSGVKTHRDNFVIGFNQEEIKQRIFTFIGNLPTDLIKQSLSLTEPIDWINSTKEKVKTIDLLSKIIPYSYRPFDNRQICYTSYFIDRDRKEIMSSFFGENLGLILRKTVENTPSWQQIFVTQNIVDINYLSAQTYIFPLYIYNNKKQQDLLEQKHRSTNLQWGNLPSGYSTYQPFTSRLTNNFIQSTEAIFYYIYAILYSKMYRQKYQEFLKIDFPKIPFTKDWELFKVLSSHGELLVNLHLLKSPELNNPVAKFTGKGESKVEQIEYKDQKVFINQNQYFYPVSPYVYNYFIGGYQVLNKWLKDRKSLKLSSEDIKHYCYIITALSKTIEIQDKIDKVYPEVEKTI